VEDVTLTPDRKYVLLNSNQNDIDRRHLWRVPVAGGAIEPLTSGSNIEWSPVMTSDGKSLAYLASERAPARPSDDQGARERTRKYLFGVARGVSGRSRWSSPNP